MKTQRAARAALLQLTLPLLCSALLLTVPRALAQTPLSLTVNGNEERVALHQALLDLTNPWTVMCVAAHPDDEDGATLTVLRRKYGVHTVTLFSTYGEGGQNAIGPELYEELGAIRARETLAASEIQGSEPSFLALRDFGFSKSAEETFRIWNRDEALSRMVLKIRQLRPDVIITNHDTVSGHGHHQATGRLLLEAFDAAADPRRFPEQLTEPNVTVWQAQRLFVRVRYEGGAGSRADEEAAQRASRIVSINPNERDTVRGTTYAEQALQALHRHASQGPWPQAVPKNGAPIIRYRLAREAKEAAPLPQDAETFLDGLRLSPEMAALLTPPTITGQPLYKFLDQRSRILAVLMDAYKQTYSQPRGPKAPRSELMLRRQEAALMAVAGIKFVLSTNDEALVPDQPATFNVSLDYQGGLESSFKIGSGGAVLLPSNDAGLLRVVMLTPGKTFSQTLVRQTPANTPINLPRSEHLYDNWLFGQTIVARTAIRINDVTFWALAKLKLNVAPAVEIAGLSPASLVIMPATARRPSTFTLRLFNHQNAPFVGTLTLEGPKRERLGHARKVSLKAKERQDVSITVPALSSLVGEKQAAEQGLTLNLSHTPVAAKITQRNIKVVWSEARTAPRLRVGYVRSFDDTLRNALTALGVEAKELKIEDVRAGNLQSFDTLIIDNRGYQAHPELIAANARLLEYVRDGGTLIVFYHKTNEWNPDAQRNRPQLAPYPITLGNARVTDETATVTFTEPQSALLNFPNKIEAKDFDGWIQERGLYYPREWDARYSAPFAMSDAGETPLRGGLLVADYGRGRYIYTSMVWYRQLRAGVPGAYRVFANMISYGHTGAK